MIGQYVKSQPTPGDTFVSRTLSNVLIAHMQDPANYIADAVFPNIPQDDQLGKFFRIPRGAWLRQSLKKRAPGTPAATLGYAMDTDSFICDVIAGKVPVEDQGVASQHAPVDLRNQATRLIADQMLQEREISWVNAFFKTGVWGTDLSPAIKWGAANSVPVSEITTGCQTIAKKTGKQANTIVFGRTAWDALKQNPEIVDRVKGGATPGSPAIVSRQAIASIFEVERVLVSNAIQNTAVEGATDAFDFIAPDHVLICHVPSAPGILIPAAGYTFTWRRMGTAGPGGQRIKVFRDENVESTWVEGQQAYSQKLVSADLGYFLNDVVA